MKTPWQEYRAHCWSLLESIHYGQKFRFEFPTFAMCVVVSRSCSEQKFAQMVPSTWRRWTRFQKVHTRNVSEPKITNVLCAKMHRTPTLISCTWKSHPSVIDKITIKKWYVIQRLVSPLKDISLENSIKQYKLTLSCVWPNSDFSFPSSLSNSSISVSAFCSSRLDFTS